jgi:hypothetical protein
MDIEGKTVEELRELNWARMLRVKDIPEYWVWADMRRRCNNPNHKNYRDYGGRGISVCPEWNVSTSFWKWLEHIGRRPVDGFMLDRKNNDKGYEPNNIRWVSPRVSHENRRPPTFRTTLRGGTSRHEGVHWVASKNKWRAQLRVRGRDRGVCSTEGSPSNFKSGKVTR